MEPNQAAAAAPAPTDNEVAVQQADLLLARRIRQLDWRICGLWPVLANMGFDEVPKRLARALASLGGTVGLVGPPAGWRQGPSETHVSISPMAEGIDALTPVWAQHPSLGTAVEQVLALVGGSYARILVDLSGVDLIGVNDVALVPGVCIVIFAPAGRTSEFALSKIRRRLPAERLMGAVLVNTGLRRSVA